MGGRKEVRGRGKGWGWKEGGMGWKWGKRWGSEIVLKSKEGKIL